MIAAIYARKSTEQHGIPEESKSVARQVEHATAYATRKGWMIATEHVYVDNGISGAEFSTRPGFVRLMAALKPRPPFDLLIMSEESRLGREQIEVSYALKQIVTAGVRVFCYLTDTERTLDSPLEKTMLALQTMADEMEREKARQRTRDGMLKIAKAGRVTGGACFGYNNVKIFRPDGTRTHTERKVNEGHAAVVRRIFKLCAEGKGVKNIAKILNAEGAPSPRPQRGCPKGWATSSVRAVLYRRTYLGEIVYGQTRKRNTWGQKKYERRPESEWTRVAQPAWRIVSDEEWAAAHARLGAAAQTYLRINGGRLWGRPATGLDARYLLSGIARCACCGASMVGHRHSKGRTRTFTYICGTYSRRGPTVCGNRTYLPMPGADGEVIAKLRNDVLGDRELIEGALADAIAELCPTADVIDVKRDALVCELRDVEHTQARLIDAIATAGDVAALAAALKQNEASRAHLTRALAALEQRTKAGRIDPRRIERDLVKRLAEWHKLLGQHTPIARQIVLKLVKDGRLVFTPKPEAGVYEFEGLTVLDKLLAGVIPQDHAVPQVWRALQDSNLRPPGS
jgi:DNA invertase Pin-like site-specific DNA recombinase